MNKKPFDWKLFIMGMLTGLVILLGIEIYQLRNPEVEAPQETHSQPEETEIA